MGLQERRAAKEFETNVLPGLTSELAKIAGFEVPVKVDWESLSVEGYASSYREFWTKVYFTPLLEALKGVCIDDMGRQALRDNLKSVVIQNKHQIHYGDRMATFDGGVLTLDHEAATNIDDVEERKKGIQTLLESKL